MKIYPKVARDVLFVQGRWTIWFLGILVIIHIIQTIAFLFTEGGMNDFYARVYIAGNIYMFVIGILSSVSILPAFVKNGVTRRDYFKGAILGTLGIALSIVIFTIIIHFLSNFVLNLFNIPVNVIDLSDMVADPDDPFIAHLILAIIGAPFVKGMGILSILLFIFNLYYYYVIGWLIGSGFSRFGGIFGLTYIVLAIPLFIIHAGIWGKPIPELAMFDLTTYSNWAALVGSFVLALITLIIIRFTTKNVRIKV